MNTPKLPPLPKPDTHCFDEDTRKDVWSHSSEQMQAYAIAAIDAQGVPDGAPQATAKELVRIADILRDCGRLVSTSGTAESTIRSAAVMLASAPPAPQEKDIRVWGWVWKDKRTEDGCCYIPSYTPEQPFKSGELLALVDPADLHRPLENTRWQLDESASLAPQRELVVPGGGDGPAPLFIPTQSAPQAEPVIPSDIETDCEPAPQEVVEHQSALAGEAQELSKILAGMGEGSYDLETLYTTCQADGDAFVRRAADLLAEMASATPAPQAERSGCTAGTDEECKHKHCAAQCPKQANKAQSDTMYLLRRLLSNQNTLTGSEFREELTKIVEQASVVQQGPVIESNMFWDHEDPEEFGHEISDIVCNYGPGDKVKIDCAFRMQTITVLVKEDWGYEIVSGSVTHPAQQAKQQPLSDEQIEAIYTQETGSLIDDSPWALVDFVRAIEAAHSIGEKK